MEYSIKDLALSAGKSKQTLYALMNSNSEFAEIVSKNSRMDKKTKLYNENCLEWLKCYYQIESNTPNNEAKTTENSSANDVSSEAENKIGHLKKKIKRLKSEIKRLQSENERLLTMLEKEQEQRQGLLYGLFASNKKLLLDEPKRHWWHKIGKKSEKGGKE